MIDLVAFGVILDDLVFPDGRTTLGVLGGGGPQTAFGMRLPALAGWISDPHSVGLVSGVGPDFPAESLEWLETAGIDLTGVRRTAAPTARAWQVMEDGDRRTQLFRVSGEVVSAQLTRSMALLPPSYQQARGFHLGVHPDDPDLAFIRELRERRQERERPMVSVEPFKSADRPPADAALRALCGACDIFSPNLAEARSLAGPGRPEELARRLVQAGARIVTLRLGADGSLVCDERNLCFIPAVPAKAVDPTGAGNAYCGAFLAGFIATRDLALSGLYASVAASFLIEQAGLPPITGEMRGEANRRLGGLQRNPGCG